LKPPNLYIALIFLSGETIRKKIYMYNIMVLYTCDKCKKEFYQKSNYDKHLQRKLPCIQTTTFQPPIPTITPPTFKKEVNNNEQKSKLQCNYCKKLYARVDVLNKHINGGHCKVKKENDNNLEQLLTAMTKKLEKMDTIVQELKTENAQYKQLITNQNNIQQQNNIEHLNNQTNNYNMNIHAYGKENKSVITDDDYKKILDKGFKAVESHVEQLHFNPNQPENQNIYISNIQKDYVLIYDGEKWNIEPRNDVLEKMYYDNADTLEQKFRQLFKVLPQSTVRKFERFINSRDDDETMNAIKERLKMLLYNNRKKIEDLRKRLKN
jgi:hypothetical protein